MEIIKINLKHHSLKRHFEKIKKVILLKISNLSEWVFHKQDDFDYETFMRLESKRSMYTMSGNDFGSRLE